jgi:hypothetical protein
MKLEELKQLYKGCATYDGQYLPTFKKILNAINSEDVEDIVNKYEEYIMIVPGLNSSSKIKHIKSLFQKLKKPYDIHVLQEDHPEEEHHESHYEDTLQQPTNQSLLHQVNKLQDTVLSLEKSNDKLQQYFQITIDHIHLLPPPVITQICLLGFHL